MRRFGWLVGVAILAVVGGGGRAQGSPLTLKVWGSAHNVTVPFDDPNNTIDVSDGFTRFYRRGGKHIDELGGTGTYWEKPVESSIDVTATLSDADRVLATVRFSGPVKGTMLAGSVATDVSGYAHGSAPGVVTIAQGVDPSLIPSWFTGLTATVDSVVGGQTITTTFQSTLIITPANPAQVPEPSSVLVFLAAAGLIGVRRLRRA